MNSVDPVTHTMIKTLMVDCCQTQGWELPLDLMSWCTSVLADHVSRPNWQPQPSYAEQFMSIRTTKDALALGNECWFTRAVFPELMARRGISSSYYVDMGQSCYDRVLSATAHPTIRALRDHFEFTAEVAWTAIHASGEFRSMWD